jgi:hypothetical protein
MGFWNKFKAFLNKLGIIAVEAAPIAEAIETAVAPETVAPTQAAAAVASAVIAATNEAKPAAPDASNH